MNTTISKDRMAELLERLRASNAPIVAKPAQGLDSQNLPDPYSISSSIYIPSSISFSYSSPETTDKFGNLITYNSKQAEFISLAASSKSCVLIGAAGTGKTTCQKGVVSALIDNSSAGILDAQGHKHLVSSTPGIVICAYTRRAVSNIRKNVSLDMQSNCITIHKLLEYAPVYNEVFSESTGSYITKMSFEPGRNKDNPLPASIRTIIFEESSMLGLDLYKEVLDACPHGPQFIFLGDIQQLPPVFGPAILGFKLTQLPTVELTDVYRQALESPIIRLAHRILSSEPILPTDFKSWHVPKKLTLHPWKKKIDALAALNTATHFFKTLYDTGNYDPEDDIILIPFNKAFGTDELNKGIANHIARKTGQITHQVVAGFNKLHFTVGDKVLYDKEDAIIKDISINPVYTGASYTKASATLDYWGHDSAGPEIESRNDEDVDFLLSQVAASEADSDRVRISSHIITLEMQDSGTVLKVDKAANINSMLLGYCLTVHKAQGSEWRRVFVCLHQSHNTMIQRELLYTAVTRAKEELYIICEPDTFIKGIESQRVKGNTLEEKAMYFRGKLDTRADYSWI